MVFIRAAWLALRRARLVSGILIFGISLWLFLARPPWISLKKTNRQETLQTRPPLPQLDGPRPPQEQYLSYLPHSGYHNQRISLQNALFLAQTLNRTLIVPYVLMGPPISYGTRERLQSDLDTQQKGIKRCHSLARSGLAQGKGDCKAYKHRALFGWSFLVDLAKTGVEIPLLQREDISRSWLTSRKGLGLNEQDIYRVPEDSKYHYRFYANVSSKKGLGKFVNRLNIEDLLSTRMQEYKLLEFGTLYGTERICMDLVPPEQMNLWQSIQKAMVFRNPMLERISDQLVRVLGGRGRFVGLHLRVGDGDFASTARANMQETLQNSIAEILHISRADTMALLESSPILEETGKSSVKDCKAKHTSSTMQPLNIRAYAATDAKAPRSNLLLNNFFQWLPCLSTLDDFRSTIPDIEQLGEIVSAEESIPIARFLIPILDAMIAAQGSVAFGTSGSTYSSFVTTTLHEHYQKSTP